MRLIEGNPYINPQNPYEKRDTQTKQIIPVALKLAQTKGKEGKSVAQWVWEKGGELVKGGEALPAESTQTVDKLVEKMPEVTAADKEGLSAFDLNPKPEEDLIKGLDAFELSEPAVGEAGTLISPETINAKDSFSLGGPEANSYTFGGGEAPLEVDASLAPEAGAQSGTGATFGGVMSYIGAAEMAKGAFGEMDQPWDERNTIGKLPSAPANPLWPLIEVDDSNVFGKAAKEMARAEQLAMAPIDALFGIKNTWLGDKMSCIIISACTNPNSYEVSIARKYRDRFMTLRELTGYYALCPYIAPLIHRSPYFKRIVKRILVDRLVDYGEWILGMKQKTKFKTSGVVKTLFLGLCRVIGWAYGIALQEA